MKHFMELSSDCIIDYRFVANYNGSEVDWADKEKRLTNGKDIVSLIRILTPERDMNGCTTGKLIESWLTKDDVVKLYEKIKTIEVPTVGKLPDDLPF